MGSTFIDISGQTFGELKVLEYVGNRYWKCRCSCNNISIVHKSALMSGRTKSCGHLNKEVKVNIKDKTFGEWYVIRYVGHKLWECKCSCGAIKNIRGTELRLGRTRHCGSGVHKKKLVYDLKDRTFGKLHVEKYIEDNKWECICECGNRVHVFGHNLRSGGTKSCGCCKSLSYESKEDYLEAINKYIDEYGDKPYLDDIAKLLGRHKENVRNNINKYGLTEFINKSFGSHYEHDIFVFCKKFVDNIKNRDRKVLNGKELDIYIPSHKLAIEFNGTYWHSFEKLGDKKYHQNKTIACAKQGIQLIHIFEYEWNDLVKQEKIKNYIKRLLTRDSQNKVFARNTEIKQITSSIADDFCNKYHLQGKATASVNYGCYLGEELIGIMTFGAPRFNNNYDYELVRLCWKDSVVVTGGTEKLLSQFIKDYNPNSIITYCDISKFTGNAYIRIGFKPIQSNPITEPNYVWCSQETDLLLPRYKTQKHQLIEQGLGTEEQTEIEIMYNHNFIQIYDCGNIRLEWIRK